MPEVKEMSLIAIVCYSFLDFRTAFLPHLVIAAFGSWQFAGDASFPSTPFRRPVSPLALHLLNVSINSGKTLGKKFIIQNA